MWNDETDVFLGEAVVREVGCFITACSIRKSDRIRVRRKEVYVHDGLIDFIEKEGVIVERVEEGDKCVMKVLGFDTEKGDRIWAYRVDG